MTHISRALLHESIRNGYSIANTVNPLAIPARMAPEQQQTLVTITHEEDLAKFAQVIASAFSNDTLNRYLLLGKESRPDHPKLSQFDLRVDFWMPMITRNFHNGGVLVQTQNWAAVAQW